MTTETAIRFAAQVIVASIGGVAIGYVVFAAILDLCSLERARKYRAPKVSTNRRKGWV